MHVGQNDERKKKTEIVRNTDVEKVSTVKVESTFDYKKEGLIFIKEEICVCTSKTHKAYHKFASSSSSSSMGYMSQLLTPIE